MSAAVLETPIKQQELLLRAAFLRGQESLEAWRSWRSSFDLEVIEPGIYGLLPQLFQNLHSQGVTDPPMERLKGIYRHTWYKNQMLFHRMAEVLRSLHLLDIETMVIGGASVILVHSKDPGLRPLDRFDILVETRKAREAMRILKELGWMSRLKEPECFVSVATSIGFTDPSGCTLQLHWRTKPEYRHEDANTDIWKTAVITTIDGVLTFAPGSTDQLFSACVEQGESSPPVSLADAVVVMNSSSDEVDWDQLASLAQRRRLILTLRDTLFCLREVLNAPVPDTILRSLESTPPSFLERIERRAARRQQRYWERLALLWLRYLRSTGDAGLGQRLTGFPRFLQYVCGADRLWQVPGRAFRKGMGRS